MKPTPGVISVLVNIPTAPNRHCTLRGWNGVTDMAASTIGSTTRMKASR
jgi:hypothetical protein